MVKVQRLFAKTNLKIPVCRNLPAGWGHPALRTNWEYRCRSGQLIRHGQLHAEHIAAHIADRADNAVLAVLLLHGGAVGRGAVVPAAYLHHGVPGLYRRFVRSMVLAGNLL